MKSILLCTISFFLSFNHIYAQWDGDPGNVVCSSSAGISHKMAFTDGANGIITVLQSYDFLSSVSSISIQDMNSNGQVQWGTTGNPKLVRTGYGTVSIEDAIPDGNGGAFVVWQDERSFSVDDIYLQHIDNTGEPLWEINGIRVNGTSIKAKDGARLCLDNNQGVIVIWDENYYDNTAPVWRYTYGQVLAQRFTSDGIPQWIQGGVQVCESDGFRFLPSVVADDSGGAIICFSDTRGSNQAQGGIFNNIDIYAQRINADGTLAWTGDGVPVNTDSYHQQPANEYLHCRSSVADGQGGVILMFTNYSNDNTGPGKFYAQKLNASGVKQWLSGGVPVCDETGYKYLLSKIISDGAGGFIAAWGDYRRDRSLYPHPSVYGQRILSDGEVGWAANGIVIAENADEVSYEHIDDIIDDGSNNYIVTWTDTLGDIKVQKLRPNGTLRWGVDGKNVTLMPYAAQPNIVRSDSGSFIICWEGDNTYATKLDLKGDVVHVEISGFVTVADGSWDNPAIWLGNIVPDSTSECTVLHHVTIASNANCKSLKVLQPNGNLTINEGINLTIFQ